MTVALYMDQHVPRAITLGLRLRGVDVLTAYEDDAGTLSDPDLLDRATALGGPCSPRTTICWPRPIAARAPANCSPA